LHDFKENVKLDPSVNYRFFFKSQEPEFLHDFKENVKLDPSVNYRFFFKSQEPEFGYLKEEVFKKLLYY